ncbi:RNA-binding cell elongation regulator Jag/EloR [Anaerococcus sp. Marseille-P3625]|uniref:RNA-binding cell elongation regulator Jag/EloR n=1 Tax=Anaerococcus sp. Marseille-P3625 TaxID=1977277 RepID=UPI000C0743EB|nr:RNA-binding cell elongation regulator Jag/EloR [Anaerococcus sp. Marseille-P3625]
MRKSIIKQAKNKEEAVELALNEIGKNRSEVEIEVIEEGSAGFLGLGSKDAIIRVTYDEDLDDTLFDFEEEIKRDSLNSKEYKEDYDIESRKKYYQEKADALYEKEDNKDYQIEDSSEAIQKQGEEFVESIEEIKEKEENLGNFERLEKINSYQENSTNESIIEKDLTSDLDKSIEKIENDGYQIKRNEMPDFSTAENTEEENAKDFPLEDLKDDQEAKNISLEKKQTDIDKYYKAKEFLEELLKQMHFENASVYGNLEGSIIKLDVKVEENDTGIAIGKAGSTLDAIELLIRKSIDSRANNLRVNVDINNYKKRRDDKIRELANDTARKVQRSRKSWNLKYMNSYERRLAHEEISKFTNVTSHSEGVEPKRYVVVEYKDEDEE